MSHSNVVVTSRLTLPSSDIEWLEAVSINGSLVPVAPLSLASHELPLIELVALLLTKK